MSRGKLRSGGHQRCPDRRDGALLLDILTSRRCLYDLDEGSLIGLGQFKRDYGVGPRRQSIAGRYCNQWQPKWIVGARP
jgi:hypothetical protein